MSSNSRRIYGLVYLCRRRKQTKYISLRQVRIDTAVSRKARSDNETFHAGIWALWLGAGECRTSSIRNSFEHVKISKRLAAG